MSSLAEAQKLASEGFINSLSGISNDPRLFQVSIPIQPGNSGGPVFNEKGELIGMATSSIDSIQTQKVSLSFLAHMAHFQMTGYTFEN